MKIAMLQLNFTVGDLRGNAEKILVGYKMAVEQGAELVVSTELGIFGYPPKDMLEIASYVEEQYEIFRELERQVGDVGLVIGIAEPNKGNGKPLFNRAFLVQNGNLIQWETKTLLPTYDVFDEDRYFEPNHYSNAMVIKYKGKRLGMLICEDIWAGDEDSRGLSLYQKDPVYKFVDQPIDILIVPNGSPYYWGKGSVRFELVKDIATKIGCSVVYVNEVGGNDELVFDGRSFAVNKFGECIAAAAPFVEDICMVDTESIRQNGQYQFDKDQFQDLYDALVLGVRDYLTKIGAAQKGALVAISGGIDSAVVAKIAVDALGPDRVLGVSLPSSFSSEGSISDAKELARNLGIKLSVVPIADVYNVFGETVKGEIDWRVPGSVKGDVTEENVQARIRGMIMMAFSNRTGRIVLTTGNKSEIAVGYCTLYGDMVGGLAVISDLPKTLVYGLAGYINRVRNQIPESIINKAPSAELAPGQKDEDSLPPYKILDGILQLFVEEKMGLTEIVECGFEETTVRWVINAVTRNEFKRQQMSPGIKVTGKAFGSGRRFPIAAKFVLPERVTS